MTNNRMAFTLAEILIAMTIIGIVAALTIPMLMSNMTARTNRLKVQKAYTTLSNALSIGESKIGYDMADLDETELTLHNFLTKTMNLTKTAMTSYPFSGKPIVGSNSGSISVASYTNSGITSGAQVYKTKEGIYYIFNPLETRIDSQSFNDIACTKEKMCVGYIDINGPEGPNELITCTTGSDAYPHFNMSTKTMVQPGQCIVDSSAITDIYPFVFYNAEAMPAINAFDAVLAGEHNKNMFVGSSSDDGNYGSYWGCGCGCGCGWSYGCGCSCCYPFCPGYSNSNSSYPGYPNSNSSYPSYSNSNSSYPSYSNSNSSYPSYSNSDFYPSYSNSNSNSSKEWWEDPDNWYGDDPGNPRPSTPSSSSSGLTSLSNGSGSPSYSNSSYDPGSGSFNLNTSTSSNYSDEIYSDDWEDIYGPGGPGGTSSNTNSNSNSNSNSYVNSNSNSSITYNGHYYLGFDTNYDDNSAN